MDSIDYVYDEKLLEQLETNVELNKHLKIRPLEIGDYDRGYIDLLSQLTYAGQISSSMFQEQFRKMKASKTYFVTVIEDLNTNQVVGTATLFLEYKILHDCALRGRIEDVVVDCKYRGQKLGIILIETKKLLAQHLNCYKLTLDCNDHMIAWYERFGFKIEPNRSNFLTIRF